MKCDKSTKEHMVPMEAKNIGKSRVLLFMVTENSLDVSSMIMVSLKDKP